MMDGNNTQCLNESCKLARAAFVNSGSKGAFMCAHIEKEREAVPVMSTHTLTKQIIDIYKSDQSTKDSLTENMNGVSFPHLYRLSDSVFRVYGPPSSSNPIGFAHLNVSNGKIDCSSSDCKGYGSVMRQEKIKKICIHLQTLLCFFSLSVLIPATSSDDTVTSNAVRSTTPQSASTSNVVCSTSSKAVASTASPQEESSVLPPDIPESSISRVSTVKLNMLNTLPYEIPASILEMISFNDSRSNDPLNATNGWPRSYSPQHDSCRLCASQLSSPRPHPGQEAGAVSCLLTNAAAFLPVGMFVKFCSKADCKAMHQVFPFNIGYYNVMYYVCPRWKSLINANSSIECYF